MERCHKIYNHPLYCSSKKHIAEMEKDRIFCLHDLQHSLDVARIAYILSLEKGLRLEKDIIYAAALLHDIGRYTDKSHNEASAELAKKILPDCDFTGFEIKAIVDAINNHRTDFGASDLSKVIHKADNLSRSCYDCKAAKECYWTNERRIHKVKY